MKPLTISLAFAICISLNCIAQNQFPASGNPLDIVDFEIENTVDLKKTSKSEISAKDARLKIRLGFYAADNFFRRILITCDQRTTDGMDYGFDAIMKTIHPNDLYWMMDENKLIIQAVAEMNVEREVPIGIVSKGNGPMKIKIDTIENPYENMKVYLRDNETMETFDILNEAFSVDLEEGEHHDKYSMVFQPKLEEEEEVVEIFETLKVYLGEGNELLKIRKPQEIELTDIAMYNVLGQQINSWSSNLNENSLDLPIRTNRGIHFVIMNTNQGRVSKKVLMR